MDQVNPSASGGSRVSQVVWPWRDEASRSDQGPKHGNVKGRAVLQALIKAIVAGLFFYHRHPVPGTVLVVLAGLVLVSGCFIPSFFLGFERAGRKFGQWGGAAISAQQVGCDLETDQTVTLSHGFDLNSQLAFGYNFNFYRLWQDRFGSAMTVGIDIGLLAKVYRNWRIGCFGHNLNHPSLGKLYQYDLPSGVGIGLSYTPFSGVLAAVEASKDVGKITRYKIGSEYELWQEKLALRAGVLNEGQLTLYSMGFGVKAKGILVGYAFEGGHQALSGTHQFGLGYKW